MNFVNARDFFPNFVRKTHFYNVTFLLHESGLPVEVAHSIAHENFRQELIDFVLDNFDIRQYEVDVYVNPMTFQTVAKRLCFPDACAIFNMYKTKNARIRFLPPNFVGSRPLQPFDSSYYRGPNIMIRTENGARLHIADSGCNNRKDYCSVNRLVVRKMTSGIKLLF